MIRLSVLYPAGEGATFDHDYYRESHVPLACGPGACPVPRSTGASTGPTSRRSTRNSSRSTPCSEAMANEGTGAIMADVANYTNITPVLQTSEVVD